nr:GNAT family protein [uncultured Flavobacterium sp.]
MIYLQPLKPTDNSYFINWINDPEVIKYSLSSFQKLNTTKQINQWFTNVLNDTKNVNLGIYLTLNSQCIGYAGLTNLSITNQSAEYFIFIGDKTTWGKGYGTEVTKQVLNYGFTKLNLNRIMLTVSKPNIGGVKAYLKAGFKQEGVFRQACFRDGKFHDKIIMSVLKSEYIQ